MLIVAALLAVFASAALCVVLVPIVARLAGRFGLIDVPSGRKSHDRPVPLGGGVTMFLAIAIPSVAVLALAAAWAASVPAWLANYIAPEYLRGAVMRIPMALVILGGAAALCALGLIDDKRHLGPWPKLAAQIVIASLVVALTNLRVLELLGEPISAILSVIWILVIVNALNFLDNMDGLAVGVTLICACALLAAATSIGQVLVAGWLCLLIGATAGFLIFNFPPARMFMGDAGSLVLGFFLAVLSMLTTYVDPQRGALAYGVFAPLILLAVPLYDFASVMFIRIREKRNPMVGDNRHFSHRLVRRGLSKRSTVLTIYLCTAVTGISAMLLPRVDDLGAILLAAQTLGVLGVIAILESTAETDKA